LRAKGVAISIRLLRHYAPRNDRNKYEVFMAYKSRYFEPFSGTSEVIAPNAITSDKIADETIESRDIKNLQVKTEDIADKAVTLAKLGDDVPAVGIPDNSIPAAKLADDCVEKRHIKTAAVDTDELANQAVTSEKIRDATITNAKIATNTITQGKIANNAIGTGEIQNGSVTPEKLSFAVPSRPLTPPVTTDEIGDGQVTGPKIASSAVGSSQLAVDSVITEKIANQAVTAEKLAPGVGGGDVLTMLPVPATALDQGGIIATTQPASVDLSTIIPLNTKGVIVSIACINQSYTDGGMMAYIFRQLGAEYALQVMAPPVNAPGISNGASVLMPVAADRTLTWQAYVAGINSTELVIYILGYIV